MIHDCLRLHKRDVITRMFCRTEMAWVLTRDQNPSDETIDAALAVLEKNGIDQKKLKLINQENCVASE